MPSAPTPFTTLPTSPAHPDTDPAVAAAALWLLTRITHALREDGPGRDAGLTLGASRAAALVAHEAFPVFVCLASRWKWGTRARGAAAAIAK
jgi:hypothetical protein